MKYLVLIYSNPMTREIWERLSSEEKSEGLDAYRALDDDLAASGELIVSEALADPMLTRRVSVTEGRTVSTDGPFAEAKELLAGFYLVDCEDMDRAVEIAARVPEAAFGVVEVRPVMDLSGFEV